MKTLLTTILIILTLNVCGQDKHNHIQINNLTEVAGTEYVIASINNMNKIYEIKDFFLLFINTKSGETNQVDFPKDAIIGKMEQIKIDNLGINVILASARTIDLYGKKGIGWDDPSQLIVLSPDGKKKTQLTDNDFSVRTWTVNYSTGTIVVAGHYGENNNKFSKMSSIKDNSEEKNEIHIYNLKTLKHIKKIAGISMHTE